MCALWGGGCAYKLNTKNNLSKDTIGERRLSREVFIINKKMCSP